MIRRYASCGMKIFSLPQAKRPEAARRSPAKPVPHPAGVLKTKTSWRCRVGRGRAGGVLRIRKEGQKEGMRELGKEERWVRLRSVRTRLEMEHTHTHAQTAQSTEPPSVLGISVSLLTSPFIMTFLGLFFFFRFCCQGKPGSRAQAIG